MSTINERATPVVDKPAFPAYVAIKRVKAKSAFTLSLYDEDESSVVEANTALIHD